MKRSRFNLGQKRTDGFLTSPKPKQTKKNSETSPVLQSPSPSKRAVENNHDYFEEEEEEGSFFEQDEVRMRGLSRAQLEIELKAVLHERDMLINHLSKLIEIEMSRMS